MNPVRINVVTANSPAGGAVAIIQCHGDDAKQLLSQISGHDQWPLSRMQLTNLAGIDQGLAVLYRDDWAQLMPHGGQRVVGKLIDKLIDFGARYESDIDAQTIYPEAESEIEAEMLDTLWRAASPMAIDLLLDQPDRWRDPSTHNAQTIRDHSAKLDRLINPPTVVVVGQPNVGKSTLTNRMLGQSASVAADLPGTTRDWVAGFAELSGGTAGVAVRWMDTPGIRNSNDEIEQAAIELAQNVISSADVLIALRDPDADWHGDSSARSADLWLINKIDEPSKFDGDGADPDAPLPISAVHGHGIDRLEHLILDRLELHDIDPTIPWAFSDALRAELNAR